MLQKSIKRMSVIIFSCMLVLAQATEAYAQVKTSGKASSYDEAYYVTTDYYGNIIDGSVVKSYTLNGLNEIHDKGKYDKITNLSDGKDPQFENGEYVFRFADGNVPDHFYYECATKEPYNVLPWDISISYKLNGVTVDAEDLPGQKGIIELDIDMVPNEKADEYSKNNYTLETAAIFSRDDIDSLEAEGAQVQLLGNLKTVLFVTLPGEELHRNIKAGTESFSFGGLTFLMVPATLGQLEEISRLAEDKEKLEDNYKKLSNRLDDTIDMIDDMGKDLGRTADDLGTVAKDADRLAGTINPMAKDLDTMKQMLDDTLDTADPLLRDMVSIKADLRILGDVISDLQDDLEDVDDKIDYLADVRNDLEDASDELVEIENDVLSVDLEEDAPKAYALYGAYLDNFASKGMSFTQALPYILTPTVKAQVEAAIRPQVRINVSAQVKAATVKALIAKGMPEAQAQEQAEAYINSTEGIAVIEAQTDAYMHTNPECIQLIEAKTKENVDALVQEYAPQETQIKHLYNLYSTNIASPSDASFDELAIVNEQLTSIVEGVSAPEMLLDDMSTLIGNVKSYRSLIMDLDALGTVTRQAVVEKGEEILNEIEVLDCIINAYRPSAEQLITDASDAAKELTTTAVDTGDMLENLSEGLKSTSDHINEQKSLRVLKEDVSDIIEDTWKDYTGDKNRLLLMDPNATPVSITGADNPVPESVQIIIRTQEIKEKDDDDTGTVDGEIGAYGSFAGNKADNQGGPSSNGDGTNDDGANGNITNGNSDNGNIFTRIVDMFVDIWHTITGIFARRDQ